MKLIKMTFAVISALSISTNVLAANTETLFKGFENGCQGPIEFDNYVQNICKYTKNKKTLAECKVGTVKLPSDMPVENVTAKNKGDHSLISLKFKSDSVMWRGLTVTGINTWHGHDNGIHGQALVVKSNSTKDAKNIAIKNGAKFIKLENDVLGPIGAEFVLKDNAVHIVCDESD